MNYLSTRGEVRGITFKDAVMMGLAEHGGLLLPATIPQLDEAALEGLRKGVLVRAGLLEHMHADEMSLDSLSLGQVLDGSSL